MSEQQGWRKVSEWGQPDAETCPWGMRWKAHEHGPEDISRVAHYLPDPSWWQPLPPPVDEVLPPPEPEPKWTTLERGDGYGWFIAPCRGRDLTKREAERAAAILNAVEAGETVGRVRPWQEAPDDDTAVLVWWTGARVAWGTATGRDVHRHRLPWMAQPAPPAEVEG